MRKRDFSAEGLDPFSYTHRETGVEYTSPFPVFVKGIRQEPLGVGILLGKRRTDLELPVIAIEDDQAEGGVVEIHGGECWWLHPIDEAFVDIVAAAAASGLIVRATMYVESLER